MKLFKKRSNGEESYWKSFTDIMAGLLLIILLVLMLLLLLLTQMNKNNNLYDYQYNNKSTYDEVKHNNNASNKYFDEMYKRQYYGQGGGGTGGGYPVSYPTSGKDTDYGHDKAAVFVTVVDEETGKTIKKEGITFELFRGENNTSNLCPKKSRSAGTHSTTLSLQRATALRMTRALRSENHTTGTSPTR